LESGGGYVVRVIETVPITLISHGKLPRNRKVLEFAVAMKHGDLFPPVKLDRVTDGLYVLKGGRHRLAARKLLGYDTIRAKIAEQERG
jgi:ParB-like chromosome segregation protein Spo0J